MRVDNRKKKKKSIKNCILNHVNNNLREYIILIILFLIGVVAGVIFINNVNESQKARITNLYYRICTIIKRRLSNR